MPVSLYLGIPGSGKTTLARTRAAEDIRRTGLPCLILDSEGANNLSDIPAAPDVRTVLYTLYGHGRNIRYIPKDEDDVERLAAGVRAGRGVVFLVDEFGYWASCRKILPSITRILRGHRHSSIYLHATTQYLSDLAPLALQCYDELYVFRNQSARGLERLRDEYSLDEALVQNLPPGAAIHVAKWTPPGAYTIVRAFPGDPIPVNRPVAPEPPPPPAPAPAPAPE